MGVVASENQYPMEIQERFTNVNELEVATGLPTSGLQVAV